MSTYYWYICHLKYHSWISVYILISKMVMSWHQQPINTNEKKKKTEIGDVLFRQESSQSMTERYHFFGVSPLIINWWPENGHISKDSSVLMALYSHYPNFNDNEISHKLCKIWHYLFKMACRGLNVLNLRHCPTSNLCSIFVHAWIILQQSIYFNNDE